MRRRTFIAGLATLPLVAHAQQPATNAKLPKIGVLWLAATDRPGGSTILIKALADLGYVDAKTTQLVVRITDTRADLRRLAEEVIATDVHVIVANSVPALEAMQLTSHVPIVFVYAADPVATGLVQSLAHPGGNVTGLSLIAQDTTGKRLALLKEAAPRTQWVTLLFDPASQFRQQAIDSHAAAAKSVGLSPRWVGTSGPQEIDRVFADMSSDGTEAVALSATPLMVRESARIAAAALAHRIPAVGYVPAMAAEGLLLSYGQDLDEHPRRAAVYVDKILKGAKPSDLPVEQPTRLKLAINLKTARALGLAISPSLIAIADEVVE